MAEAESAPAAVKPRRPALAQATQIALEGVALAFLIAGTIGFVAYRSREEVAAQLAQDWLARHIRADDGELRLATPYGLVRADHGQASLSEGKVRRLDARFLPGKFHAGSGAAELAGGELHASGDGEAIAGTLTLDLPTVGQ